MRENGVIPWRRYFTVEINLPATAANDFLKIGLAFESQCPTGGAITTRIECAKSTDETQEAFVLDFDFAKAEKPLTASHLRTYMTESHDHTKQIFDGIVTADYKAVMKGKVLG